MKKIFLVMMLVVTTVTFTACGNKDLIDTVRKYDYAIVSMLDGTVEIIDIKQWRDYDGEQIQITAEDGTVYLLSSVNCILVKGQKNVGGVINAKRYLVQQSEGI